MGRRTTGRVGGLPSEINVPVPRSPHVGYLHAALHYAYVTLNITTEVFELFNWVSSERDRSRSIGPEIASSLVGLFEIIY